MISVGVHVEWIVNHLSWFTLTVGVLMDEGSCRATPGRAGQGEFLVGSRRGQIPIFVSNWSWLEP